MSEFVVLSLVCKRDVRYPPQNYNLTPKIAHITSNIRTSPLNFLMLFGSVKLNTTGSGWYITNASTPLLDKSSNDLTLSMLKPRSASNLMLRRERIPGLSTSGRGCSNKCRTVLGNLGDGHSISVGLITLQTLINRNKYNCGSSSVMTFKNHEHKVKLVERQSSILSLSTSQLSVS